MLKMAANFTSWTTLSGKSIPECASMTATAAFFDYESLSELDSLEINCLNLDDKVNSNLIVARKLDLSGSNLQQLPDNIVKLLTITRDDVPNDSSSSSSSSSTATTACSIGTCACCDSSVCRRDRSNQYVVNASTVTASETSIRDSNEDVSDVDSLINQTKRIHFTDDLTIARQNDLAKRTTDGWIVEDINLARNQLNSDDALKPLTVYAKYTLKRLTLTANHIRAFPVCLLHLTCLETLDLSGNCLQNLPNDIANLTNLKELKLDHNELQRVPKTLRLLRKLSQLHLSDNQIDEIPEFLNMRTTILTDLLEDATEEGATRSFLERINLRANQLKGSIILGNYGTLTNLDVSDNRIENLDLSALDKLEILHCSRNRLVELSLNGKCLRTIIAGNNDLKKIQIHPPPIFLQHLDLSHNSLSLLPSWISDCSELRSLFVSHNNLTTLPEHLFCSALTTNIQTLQLGYNKLTSLPPVPRQLQVQELFLQHNALESLPENFFHSFNKMVVINLSNNHLTQLPFTNLKFSCLEKIYLTVNCLTDKAWTVLKNFNNLKTLHAAYNNFTMLPDMCVKNWLRMQELVLSGNAIVNLPENITLLRHLRILRIHSNNLQTCPGLVKLQNLAILDLAHNQLDRINLSSIVSPNLQFLDVSCNSKLHVDGNFYTYQRPMSLIDVSGKNRKSLPLAPDSSSVLDVRNSKNRELPWKIGFSETAGTSKPSLYISQLRLPTFCNAEEGLFGIFDGENNNMIPSVLEQAIPRIVLEERSAKETACQYMKYTMLSAHRELQAFGQNCGVCATLVHITRQQTSSEMFQHNRFVLRVANLGLAKCVLYRKTGAVCLTPSSPRRQLGYSAAFSMVSSTGYPITADPEVAEVNIDEDDEFIVIANKHVWEVMSVDAAVEQVKGQNNPILAAKRIQDLAQSYGAEDNISVIVVRFQLGVNGLDGGLAGPQMVPVVATSALDCECCTEKSTCEERSSPSGQSDHNLSELSYDCQFKRMQRLHNARKMHAEKQAYRGIARAVRAKVMEDTEKNQTLRRKSIHGDSESDSGLSEEQFKCWEYMLEQNTQLLFDKELNTLTKNFSRNPRCRRSNLSLSSPQLECLGSSPGRSPTRYDKLDKLDKTLSNKLAPFLSKRFSSARFQNGMKGDSLNGGPNAAYFGSLQRLMPYNLEYDFDVIQEKKNTLDSLDFENRMQQYWDVATTEL